MNACPCNYHETRVSSLLRSAAWRLQRSERAFHRLPKLVRMIADLSDAEMIAAAHIAVALRSRLRVDARMSH
jgi:predicted ATPase with chaperone activity